MVSEKISFTFSYCKSTENDDPWGKANIDPRSMIGRIYVGYHLLLLHTKNIKALGLMVYEKKIFLIFLYFPIV